MLQYTYTYIWYMYCVDITYYICHIYVTKIMTKDAMNLKESIALHERCWMEGKEGESDIVASNFENEKIY